MSRHLEGEDAFEKILDRLIESERLRGTEVAERNETSAGRRIAETDLANANRELLHLKAEIAANKPKLKELWEVANLIRDILAGAGSKSPISEDTRIRLNSALTAAAGPCDGDEIPF